MGICKDCKFWKQVTENQTVNGLTFPLQTYRDITVGDETKRIAQCGNMAVVLADVVREEYSSEILDDPQMLAFQSVQVVTAEDDTCPLFELP